MAKCRFPGKALKLKNRKRIKFRKYSNSSESFEELYSRKIYLGLEAFRDFFGQSDEVGTVLGIYLIIFIYLVSYPRYFGSKFTLCIALHLLD